MDYQDLDLRPSADTPSDSPPPQSPPAPPPTYNRPQSGPRVMAALLILAVAATGYLVFRHQSTSDSANAPAASPTNAPATPLSLGAEAEAITLPPLDESDDAVRELVKQLSSHPSVAAWLATDDLIRTFTVVVSNIASGERASGLVPALKPRTPFIADERGEEAYIDPRSYARYTPLATAASSIDPTGAAKLYTTLKPRIEDAYLELGQPNTSFDQALERAIILLLRTPIPDGRVPIQPIGVVYGFIDPKLEALTPSQKLLIRFGPDNARAVQSSLRAIALALGIPADKL